MNRRQRLIVGIGIAVGISGIAMILSPALAPDLRIVSLHLAIIALVTFALAVYLGKVTAKDHQSIALPCPEHRMYPVPGDDIDRWIASLSSLSPRQTEQSETHKALQARLEQAALTILSRTSPDDAQLRTQLTEGTWTDNASAADFFTDFPPSNISLQEQLHRLRTGESPIQHRTRHTIAVLAHTLHTGLQGTIASSDADRQDDETAVSLQPLTGGRVNQSEDAHGSNCLHSPDVGETTERRTGRWQGVSALALAASAAGMVLRQPAVLLASVVGVGLAAYTQAATPPSVDLEIERTVSDTYPPVGAEVQVTVTIRNVGDTLLPDCSVIDGVPPDLAVTDGSPRYGTALRPGKTTVFSYTLAATRGKHTFAPAAVIARDFSGSVERLTRIESSAVTTITCVPQLEPLDTVQLRNHADQFGGRVTTDIAGNGVEFHAVREYHPSDPRSRIDWNRLAKTGELSTLQFREERVTTVVVIIDARSDAYLAAELNGCSAVNRSIEAAGRIFTTLLDENTRIGLTALSPHSQTCWLAPGTGDAHHEQARQILATHPALSATHSTGHNSVGEYNTSLKHLRRRLPADAQVIVLTPLCDDNIREIIQQLESLSYAPTVISPDPSALSSPGRQLAHIERVLRITDLRSGGVPVLNWLHNDTDPLSVAINRLGVQEPSYKNTRGQSQYER